MKWMVICEEKYAHTPDDFKSATRQQCQCSSTGPVCHLRFGKDMINDYTLNKAGIQSTAEEKQS